MLSAALGWLMAGRVLRPLRAMTAAARAISADDLSGRLAVPGPGDELKDLGDTIDEFLHRLETAFGAQRRFAASASHELRTPLAMMRTSLDVATGKPGPSRAELTVLPASFARDSTRPTGWWRTCCCWPAPSTGPLTIKKPSAWAR